MIVTLTPNPSLDLTYRVDGLPVGDVLQVATPEVRAGGQGLNVARVLEGFGEPVVAVSTAGGAVGQQLERELAASQVPHELVAVAAETRRSIAIVDTRSDSTTVMDEPGQALAPIEVERLIAAAWRASSRGDVVVVSGSLPTQFPVDAIHNLVRAVRLRATRTIVDLTGPALLALCAAGVDVITTSVAELCATTGEQDPIRGARMLASKGACMVAVMLGADGMLAVTAGGADRVLRARPRRLIRGDPRAAGDAATAALACGLAHGESVSAMLQRAVAWSAAVVTSPPPGSGAARWEEFVDDVIVEDGA